MAIKLSIIIVSYNAEKTICQCLDSLVHQTQSPQIETIVIDSSLDKTAQLVTKQFPRVKLFCFAERKYPGDARNIGIEKAKGEIIAFIDADCVASSNWVEQILEAHKDKSFIIGGAIGNYTPSNNSAWAAYFCEFSSWMPARSESIQKEVPTANASYKKSIFSDVGPFIENTYCSDSEFHWRAKKKGHKIYFNPKIQVYHQSIGNLKKLLKHEFSHGRYFARVRSNFYGFSLLKRLVYSSSFLLIAAKLLIQIVFRNLTNRIYLGKFLLVFPGLCLAVFSWSFGEAVGYLSMRGVSGGEKT